MLKAPGCSALKLTYDEPLSTSAFNVNLRLYKTVMKTNVLASKWDQRTLKDAMQHAKTMVYEGQLLMQCLVRRLLRTRTRPTLNRRIESACLSILAGRLTDAVPVRA